MKTVSVCWHYSPEQGYDKDSTLFPFRISIILRPLTALPNHSNKSINKPVRFFQHTSAIILFRKKTYWFFTKRS